MTVLSKTSVGRYKNPNARCKTVIITGASGFIASFVIARLAQEGWSLLLVSRTPEVLEKRYPEHRCCGYDVLAEQAQGAQALIHLATRNSNVGGTLETFIEANVAHLETCLQAIKRAGVRQVIYTSSLNAHAATADPYGVSKYRALALLANKQDFDILILHLAAVYGDNQYRGKLRHLYRVPRILRGFARDSLGALRPIVHESKVTDQIVHRLQTVGNGRQATGTDSRFVTDAQCGNRIYAFWKRGVDLVFALILIGLFWWLLAVLWIAVKLTSPGPGIFTQSRIGRYQRNFTLFKFRTMAQGTRQAGTHAVSTDALTRLGKALRRSKLDELPQVVNILCGQISLVGPRPCLQTQHELRKERQARGVFDVAPGITGLAQVRGIDMSTPKPLACVDAEYVALRSIPLDLRIIFATFLGAGRGDPAQNSR